MNHSLGLSDSDDEKRGSGQDDAAQAIHAAGLDSDEDDVRSGDEKPTAPETDEAGAEDDGDNTFKALGLEGSDDEFNDRQGLEDDEEKQPSSGPRSFRPDRTYRPPEVWKVPLLDRPSDQLRIITLKSMVDIESAPYQADDFTLDDGFSIDERGKKVLRAPVLNRIRFRYRDAPDNGTLQLESNSRIVRWTDGSLSLMIGKECVDLSEEPIEGQRMLLGLYNNDLKIIQGQQLLRSRLLLRPPAHDSNLHRNMTQNLASARQASTKVKANAVLEDFGHEHMAALDRDKEQMKLREKQSKAVSKRRHSSISDVRRPVSQRISVPFLEADDDDDDDYGQPRTSLGIQQAEAQEKRLLQVKQAKRPRFLADDDDDVALSDDDEPPPSKPKRNALLDSDDEF